MFIYFTLNNKNNVKFRNDASKDILVWNRFFSLFPAFVCWRMGGPLHLVIICVVTILIIYYFVGTFIESSILLCYWGVTPTGSTQKHDIAAASGLRKDWETRKSRSKEKVVDFSSTSPFPARKREADPRVVSTGDRQPYAEDNPGSRYRDRGRIPDTFT